MRKAQSTSDLGWAGAAVHYLGTEIDKAVDHFDVSVAVDGQSWILEIAGS